MIYPGTIFGRWSRKPALRPLDLFDLTGATYLSFNGLLLTYTIVLLQFKTGEDGGQSGRAGEFNSTSSVQ